MIVDASVAVRWYVPDDLTDRAIAICTDKALTAPDLILYECANAFLSAHRFGTFGKQEALDAIADLPKRFARLHSVRDLIDDALDLAIELEHPAYDCVYLALARREKEPCLTADKRLFRKACSDPRFANVVEYLPDCGP